MQSTSIKTNYNQLFYNNKVEQPLTLLSGLKPGTIFVLAGKNDDANSASYDYYTHCLILNVSNKRLEWENLSQALQLQTKIISSIENKSYLTNDYMTLHSMGMKCCIITQHRLLLISGGRKPECANKLSILRLDHRTQFPRILIKTIKLSKRYYDHAMIILSVNKCYQKQNRKEYSRIKVLLFGGVSNSLQKSFCIVNLYFDRSFKYHTINDETNYTMASSSPSHLNVNHNHYNYGSNKSNSHHLQSVWPWKNGLSDIKVNGFPIGQIKLSMHGFFYFLIYDKIDSTKRGQGRLKYIFMFITALYRNKNNTSLIMYYDMIKLKWNLIWSDKIDGNNSIEAKNAIIKRRARGIQTFPNDTAFGRSRMGSLSTSRFDLHNKYTSIIDFTSLVLPCKQNGYNYEIYFFPIYKKSAKQIGGKMIIRLNSEWRQQRIIWIGFLKNETNNKCLIKYLPKDIVKLIVSMV